MINVRSISPAPVAIAVIVVVALGTLGTLAATSERSAPESRSGRAATEPTIAADPSPIEGTSDAPVSPFAAKGDIDNAARAADADAGIASMAEADSAPVASSKLAPPAAQQRIARTATLQLRVKGKGFDDAWSEVSGIAGAFGGSIQSADRSSGLNGRSDGTIVLRIPTARFDAALDRFRDVPRTKIEQLQLSSDDVTAEYVDASSRLRHDRAVERRLVALLGSAKTVGEVLAVQSRLDSVQEQIEVAAGRIAYIDAVTSMSTVSVTLRDPAATPTTKTEREPSTLSSALTDARERATDTVAAAIVWLGGVLPGLGAVILALVGVRVVLRRRASARQRVIEG